MKYTITVDHSKCTLCKACINHCSHDVFSIQNNRIIVKAENTCFLCGHCVLYCKNNAVDFISTPPFFKINSDPLPLSNEQLLFHKKRSTRFFQQKQLTEDDIKSLIEYANKAPSACNFRNRAFHVITNKKTIDLMRKAVIRNCIAFLIKVNPFTINLLSIFNKNYAFELSTIRKTVQTIVTGYKNGKDTIFFNAPCIICISSTSYTPFSNDDCIIAQQYMMLYGATKNIESCISGLAQLTRKPIEKLLKTKKHYRIYAVTIFGYKITENSKDVIFTNDNVTWN
jgi:NAD-dependent dihydropyrimidine dehydrogenase PreA subunit/nitroreductase